MIILRATEQHWSALSLLAQKTFSDTYGHTYEPHSVKKHLEANYTQSVITHEIQTELVFLVCDDDDVDGQRPWGFCQLKPNSRNEPRWADWKAQSGAAAYQSSQNEPNPNELTSPEVPHPFWAASDSADGAGARCELDKTG
ncbi:hypothetical protein HDU98_003149 [Podochytrium sp. JEL0797]|nr:hypothetical protein HDU98_003149 [Podochytrium sp. JEL0797]